jgi:hypothetical protein
MVAVGLGVSVGAGVTVGSGADMVQASCTNARAVRYQEKLFLGFHFSPFGILN